MRNVRMTIWMMVIVLASSCNVQADLLDLHVYDHADIQHGDYYHQVWCHDNATVDMFGGYIQSGLYPWESSVVTVYDGVIDYGLLSNNTSTTTVLGGYFDTINAAGSSTINIYGGDIENSVSCSDSGILNIYGGNVDKYVGAYYESNSEIHIFGYGFSYDPLGGSDNGGQLIGYWAGGSPFSIDFRDTETSGYSTYYDFVELHEVSVSPKTGQVFKVELFSGILERKTQKGTRNNGTETTTIFSGIQGPCGAGSPAGGQNAGPVGERI